MKFRIYIDESGNPDLENSENPLHRFLSITGVIFELEYVASVLAPEVEQMKKNFFLYHPDEPPIFHRKEIINKIFPFDRLKDPQLELDFNESLLTLLTRLHYTVITVVVDKKMQRDLYNVWHYDPYHYCLAILLERYVHFLEKERAIGDALAESRGGKEDLRLKRSYEKLFNEGTAYISSERFSNSITSKQLKVKPKANNIAGLQIADIIAHPSQKLILKMYKKIETTKDIFGEKIGQILLSAKYYRNANGGIEGYGIKLLP